MRILIYCCWHLCKEDKQKEYNAAPTAEASCMPFTFLPSEVVLYHWTKNICRMNERFLFMNASKHMAIPEK